jgi:subtilase family serine protease
MSRRRTLTTVAALAALATPATALAATGQHHAHQRWVATSTRALQIGKTSRGSINPHRTMSISLGLALRHRAAMDHLATSMSTPGSASFEHFLRPRQVRARFGPTPAAVKRSTSWLRANGFRHVSAAPNGLLVSAQAPAATVERSFNTQINRFRIRGESHFANVKPALVPASLAGTVNTVLGLSNLSMSLPHTAADTSPDLTGFTPDQVSKIYQAQTVPAANNTSDAIIAMGDMTPIIKNLRFAEKQEHYRQVPVKIVYGGPKEAITKNNPLTGNAEWDLDTQMATMEAKAVKTLYIYDEQTFTDEDVARGINEFVSDDKATSGSASLGECDYIAWADGAMLTTDEALEEGALQGQSMFASTGDNGSFCPEVASTGVPGGAPGTSWPADGTWTTAAGGTTVIADSDGNVTAETAWVGGGGGISPFESAGDWTIPANPASQANQYTNQGGRSVPDVSALADENTPVLIYTGDKTPEGIGGTSVSAPLLNGLWTRIQGVHRNKLGVASIRFYGVFDKANPGTTTTTPIGTQITNPTEPANPVPGFRDVVLGSDGLFDAAPGYDYTTGIGTPLVATLSKELK